MSPVLNGVIAAVVIGGAAFLGQSPGVDQPAPPASNTAVVTGTYPDCKPTNPDGRNHPCTLHGKVYQPVEWRVISKAGLDSVDHECWRLVMTLAHPGPDDPDESNFSDCDSQAVYDSYQVGDSYWSPDPQTMLFG